MVPLDPAIASRREPEGRDTWYPPLASMAMSAEDEIDCVVVFQLIEDVRRMSQQEDETILCARWKTAQIG